MYRVVVLVLCLLTPVAVSYLHKNCDEIKKQFNSPSGVYTIYPDDDRPTAVQAYCDMNTDGGGWTVFQTRMDGSVGFTRRWNEYERGFGNASGEYWLGLENLYHLTKETSEMRVDMEDFNLNIRSALYSSFYIHSKTRGYLLNVGTYLGGTAGDSLSYHNGQRFSTIDVDYDAHSSESCAKLYLGGFWYNACFLTNPNGAYLWGDTKGSFPDNGVIWNTWLGNSYSLKSISMKVRPVRRREEQDEQTKF